jgi:hypothetical protein
VQEIFEHVRRDVGVKILTVAFAVLFGLAGNAHAAHPLITDDAGTQGKGKAQIAFIGEYDHENKDGVTTEGIVAPTIPVLSYSMINAYDIVFGEPCQQVRTNEFHQQDPLFTPTIENDNYYHISI